MRLALIAILSLFLVFIGLQIALFSKRSEVAERNHEVMAAELAEARAEQTMLETDHAYYLDPANLEKELRARFNYRAPGETLVIIVPKQ